MRKRNQKKKGKEKGYDDRENVVGLIESHMKARYKLAAAAAVVLCCYPSTAPPAKGGLLLSIPKFHEFNHGRLGWGLPSLLHMKFFVM